MTGRQRRRFETYLGELAAAMGLAHWQITIRWDSRAEPDCHAQVTRYDGFRCELELEDGFTQRPRRLQRAVLCHELMHLHTAGIAAQLDAARSVLDRQARDLWERFASDAEEHCVETVACAWAECLTLPPWR